MRFPDLLPHIARIVFAPLLLAGTLSVQHSYAAGPVQDAGEVLRKFVASVRTSSVSFDYTFSVTDRGTEIKGSGSARMQGDAYKVSANGLDVYCSGTVRWTVDRQAREVVIEACDPAQPDYTVNPVLLLGYFDKAFSVVSSVRNADGSFGFILEPVSDGTDMRTLAIRLSPDGKCLTNAGFATDGGMTAEFVIASFATSPPDDDPSAFSFDVSCLDSSYVVTDLR